MENMNDMWRFSYWKESWARNLCWFLGFSVLFFIVLRAYFSWRWADDFCSINMLRDKSIWQYAWFLYDNLDGRGLMIGFISGTALKYLSVAVINMIWSGSLIGSAYFIYKILAIELPFLNKDKFNSLIQVAAISVALWLGMSPHISETVYWTTGGFYMFSVMIGLTWIYFFIRPIRNNENSSLSAKQAAVIFFLSILAGMFSYNLSIGLIALGGAMATINWLRFGKKTRKFLAVIIGSLGILIGTVVISIAPGNFVRSVFGPRSFQLNIWVLSNNYLETLKYFISLSGYLIIFSIIVALILTFLIGRKFKLRKELAINITKKIVIYFNRDLLINIMERSKYLFAGLATVLPFIFVPDFVAARASIYFMVFLLLFLLSSFIIIFKKIFFTFDPNSDNLEKMPPKFAYVFLCLVFFLQLSVIIPHNIEAYAIEKKVIERNKILSEKKNIGEDVVVKPLKFDIVPFSAKFNDISPDPESWINVCVSEHYDLNSIKIEGEK